MTNKLSNLHHHQDCICAQMLLFLPSNKDHLSRKRILLLQIFHFLLSLNVPQLFQIFLYKQRICLLGCLLLFTHHDFHQYQRFFVCMVTFDIRVDLAFKMMERKCEKKVLENEKMYEMSLMKKSSNFTLRIF